jgi:hypothetical protein
MVRNLEIDRGRNKLAQNICKENIWTRKIRRMAENNKQGDEGYIVREGTVIFIKSL